MPAQDDLGQHPTGESSRDQAKARRHRHSGEHEQHESGSHQGKNEHGVDLEGTKGSSTTKPSGSGAADDFAPMQPPPNRRVRMRCVGWHGTPPRRGDYLHGDGPRARVAYRVLLMRWKWHQAERVWKGPLWCIRLRIADIPEGARVHTWHSVPRRRKR